MNTKRDRKRHVSHDGSVREYDYEKKEWIIIQTVKENNNNNKELPLAITGRQFDLTQYFPYLYSNEVMSLKTLCKYKSKFTINHNALYIGNMLNNNLKKEMRKSMKQQNGDTGNTLWDTSILFAKVLECNTFSICHDNYNDDNKHNNDDDTISKMLNISGKNVLELGAGFGFVGLCASYCNAHKVWLTDLKYCINNMQINVDKNKYIYDQCNDDINNPFDNVFVFELDWSNAEKSLFKYNKIKKNSIDIIIGSDIIWLKELVPLLVDTLDYLYENILNKESGVIIIGEQMRSNLVSELFWNLMKMKGFSTSKVGHGLYHPNFPSNTILLSIISKHK